jgi:hypothetical protein
VLSSSVCRQGLGANGDTWDSNESEKWWRERGESKEREVREQGESKRGESKGCRCVALCFAERGDRERRCDALTHKMYTNPLKHHNHYCLMYIRTPSSWLSDFEN